MTCRELMGRIDRAEVRKKRDENPQWFADVVTKYGLGGGKGDEIGTVKG